MPMWQLGLRFRVDRRDVIQQNVILMDPQWDLVLLVAVMRFSGKFWRDPIGGAATTVGRPLSSLVNRHPEADILLRNRDGIIYGGIAGIRDVLFKSFKWGCSEMATAKRLDESLKDLMFQPRSTSLVDYEHRRKVASKKSISPVHLRTALARMASL